ncbi:MAG: AI-2E family transporter [Nitrospirae bacterium]|nr:AI-2E family transporter [Nitrospirota bacterium]
MSKVIYLIFSLLIFYLFYKVFSPFIFTTAWAIVFSITFYPLYKLILKSSKRPWSASLMTLIVIIMVVLVPFFFILGSLANDISDIYSRIEEQGVDSIVNFDLNRFVEALAEKFIPGPVMEKFNIQESLVNNLKSAGQYIIKHTTNIFANVILFVVNFIIMCMTIFFLLRDGEALALYLKKILPLNDEQKEKFAEQIKQTVIAAVYGGVTVGIVQGFLGGIAFWLFDLASPVFWGTTMAIMSLVPLFGCFLVWGPAGIIMILSGSYLKGAGLLLFGALIISSVDNIIKPMVIGSRTKMHTLLVFLSVLGGIKFMGPAGVILGPLITALFLTLFETHKEEM